MMPHGLRLVFGFQRASMAIDAFLNAGVASLGRHQKLTLSVTYLACMPLMLMNVC